MRPGESSGDVDVLVEGRAIQNHRCESRPGPNRARLSAYLQLCASARPNGSTFLDALARAAAGRCHAKRERAAGQLGPPPWLPATLGLRDRAHRQMRYLPRVSTATVTEAVTVSPNELVTVTVMAYLRDR